MAMRDAVVRHVALVPGDGIGPEVTEAARQVLEAVAARFGCAFSFDMLVAGGAALDTRGEPLPQSTIDACKAADAVLLGAVGGPKWDGNPAELRPERALLGLRHSLGLYSNIRPVRLYRQLASASPLSRRIVDAGFDIVIVRELTGGIYFGERGRRQGPGGLEAFDTECYSSSEIRRIAHVAFQWAAKRSSRVTSIDKANVLESSRLWREVTDEVAGEYPQIEASHMLVDNAAMQLVRDPSQFDVILTSNMFGDILSDEASQLTGSIGLLPSASLGDGKRGLYEPIHGSAPDIAGRDIANPIATVLAAAMMLRFSFDMDDAALAVESAVEKALESGARTADIAWVDALDARAAGQNAVTVLGTRAMAQRIIECL
jgi:3-isopropylmalate dehydrogenase